MACFTLSLSVWLRNLMESCSLSAPWRKTLRYFALSSCSFLQVASYLPITRYHAPEGTILISRGGAGSCCCCCWWALRLPLASLNAQQDGWELKSLVLYNITSCELISGVGRPQGQLSGAQLESCMKALPPIMRNSKASSRKAKNDRGMNGCANTLAPFSILSGRLLNTSESKDRTLFMQPKPWGHLPHLSVKL